MQTALLRRLVQQRVWTDHCSPALHFSLLGMEDFVSRTMPKGLACSPFWLHNATVQKLVQGHKLGLKAENCPELWQHVYCVQTLPSEMHMTTDQNTTTQTQKKNLLTIYILPEDGQDLKLKIYSLIELLLLQKSQHVSLGSRDRWTSLQVSYRKAHHFTKASSLSCLCSCCGPSSSTAGLPLHQGLGKSPF